LVEAAPVTDPVLERTILPPEVTGPPLQPAPATPHPAERPAPVPAATGQAYEEPTKPATFHLPISLIQRLRATCRLKNTTMVDFVKNAIQEALERQKPTEEEIRKLLG
jgi:hypothetical protein